MTTDRRCGTCLLFKPMRVPALGGNCLAASSSAVRWREGESLPASFQIKEGVLTRKRMLPAIGADCAHWVDKDDPMPSEFTEKEQGK